MVEPEQIKLIVKRVLITRLVWDPIPGGYWNPVVAYTCKCEKCNISLDIVLGKGRENRTAQETKLMERKPPLCLLCGEPMSDL